MEVEQRFSFGLYEESLMKKLLVCVVLLGLVASTASAEPFVNPNDRSQQTILTSATAEPIPGGPLRVADYPIYSQMSLAGTLAVATFTGGVVSADDYSGANAAPPNMPPYPPLPPGISIMDHFQFVGGVSAPGEVLFLTFFDSAGSYVGSFGIQLPYGGAYIWTITGAGGTSMQDPVSNIGFTQMWADDGSVVVLSTGIWYLDTAAPTVGTTGPTLPGFTTTGGAVLNHCFSILVPEPGTLALFGMGVMTLVVRRRR